MKSQVGLFLILTKEKLCHVLAIVHQIARIRMSKQLLVLIPVNVPLKLSLY